MHSEPTQHRPTLGEKMKRIELVIEPSALDRFTEAAEGLNLSDFDVTEVRRTPGSSRRKSQRFYRGSEFVLDLVERLKVDLTVADDAATRIVHELIERVRPESIAILRLDHTAAVTGEAIVRSTHATSIPMTSALVAAH
jgi:nitrogen regulatory protein PII